MGTKNTAGKTATRKSSSKVEKLNKANLAAAATKVEEKQEKAKVVKEMKYNYDSSLTTLAQKKTFRRTARAANKRFLKDIKALAKSNEAADAKKLKALQAEYATFQKETYSSGFLAK